MNLSMLENVVLNPKDRGSTNYAKARCAIEEAAKNRAEKRTAKNVVVEHLHGKIEHVQKGKFSKTIVVFPDNSTARY